MDSDIYDKLLYEVSNLYKKIPIKEKTFMDVSGYPHYENVSSNILAFFFNTKEEHHFNSLIMNSFIKVLKNKNINIDVISDDENIDVSREYTTLRGNRIDIVLENDNFVIGIENKLDASIYNDLEDYTNTLNKMKKNSIKILLSLHDSSKVIENTEFINITYQEFFNQLKNIYRQGWLKVRIGLEHKDKCESIADHSFSVALLALTIIEKNNLNLDVFKCIKMGIVHELGEVYAGDCTPYDNITKEEKHIKEKEAILNKEII